MALKLRPVKMKNSLYLLIPKSISQLLEIDQSRECVLTTETSHGQLLKYAFSPKPRENDLPLALVREKRRRPGALEVPAKIRPVSP